MKEDDFFELSADDEVPAAQTISQAEEEALADVAFEILDELFEDTSPPDAEENHELASAPESTAPAANHDAGFGLALDAAAAPVLAGALSATNLLTQEPNSQDDAANKGVVPAASPEPRPAAAEPNRRADIDAKQEVVARILAEMECEAVMFLMPAHVAWFTGGMAIRGLIADGERPGIYTNGRQRWLVCGNVDSQRMFDEELNGLGFMLKEWQWPIGRAVLLGDMLVGKKVACDRPFPNMKLINDKLRPELRPLYSYDRVRYLALGQIVAHALEATARGLKIGDSEQEVAGQLAHRLYHRGVEVASVSIAADQRAGRFRRTGFTTTPLARLCNLQVTATRDGLYVTASRTVCFGAPTQEERAEYDMAVRLSAIYRSLSQPGATLTAAATAAVKQAVNTPYEHEWRLSQPGYSAGWFAADELRKASVEEKLVLHQPLVWQTRVCGMAITDTVLVSETGGLPVTPPGTWPYKQVRLGEHNHNVPDILVRS